MTSKISITIIIVLLLLCGYLYVSRSPQVAVEAIPETSETKVIKQEQKPVVTSSTKTTITEILPGIYAFKQDEGFMQGEGAMIPLSWKTQNPPVGSMVYLTLLSSDGSESLGRITNSSDCTKGGDALFPNSVASYKWDGLFTCSNWQVHSVVPGSYKIGVQLYSKDGSSIIASGQSNKPFNLLKSN